MRIIKKVVVKQILTEKRKQHLLSKISSQKVQLAKEIQQLEFQLHKNVKNSKNNFEQQAALKKSFTKEIKQRNEKIKILDFQADQVEGLPLGVEIKDQTVDSICDVRVGDHWSKLMEETEIIIKDDLVHEIRKGRVENDEMV
ncbi:YlqD family protein [Anaerobacillus sp. MEB173]|uniref:YlqD family protein n=1 Tax=Anaerobacillus sp. MEB173 TaxID=3383345 RepID=UPI003F8F2F2F